MVELIKNIKIVIKNNYFLVILGLAIFGVGTIAGFFALSDNVLDFYNERALNFYSLALGGSTVKFIFIRISNLFLLFIPIIILSLNSFSNYISFIFVFYKGVVLTISFKCLFVVFGFNGIIIFIVLSLIQSITTVISMLAFIILSSSNKCKNKDVFFKNLIKISVFTLIIALIGILLEFILLVTFLKPFNFYF
ncbi:MAG: hypothetical protein IKA85_01460 [Clostridia bacterium]|nr:hypothetical protein [Clostridia bacterium]